MQANSNLQIESDNTGNNYINQMSIVQQLKQNIRKKTDKLPMDLLIQFLSILLSILTLLICICFYQSRKPKLTLNPPEAGGAWPIIGHMHLLGGRELVHKTLGAMADKYGPVFTIRLGSHRALVVSSAEMAKECFTIHDNVFCTRPKIAASKVLGYEYAMFAFAPYGSYWRELRKIATLELLSNYRLDMLRKVRDSEVKYVMKELYDMWIRRESGELGVLVDVKKWFADLTRNVLLKMVGGKQCLPQDCQKVMRDFFYLFGVFVLSDSVPFLGWLDYGGYKKMMKTTAKELDSVVERWLEEHKRKRSVSGKGEGEEDFMDVMLNILEDAKVFGFDADTINKATCLILILAGSDATMVTLIWALSLLLNNPHALNKAQEELDIHVGKDRNVDESDIKNLVYLQGIVKETLRLYPPNPVLSLREAMQDCTLSAGYHIAAGTRLMVNTWKIHHDERVWSNPNEFQPERFLTSHKDRDVKGKNFELIPFGGGRRSCPGASLALQVVHMGLASFLHSFEVSKVSNELIDMTESAGMTNLKATPLEVFIIPRLDSKLYEL